MVLTEQNSLRYVEDVTWIWSW